MNLLLKVTYEHDSHNGLTELLEILSSIVSGFTVPLKNEHKDFFMKVIIPLHKVKNLSTFNTQLQSCVKNFLEKDNTLSLPLIKGLFKMWPITNPAKEVVFFNEIEEILDLYQAFFMSKFNEFGQKLLKRIIKTS
jgi:serine/threonine-protein phosphatase 2A regulatory subunit B'